jgi:hypothetical protein
MAAVGGVEVIDLGFVANEALLIHRFVKATSTAREVDQCGVAGEAALGVAQHNVEAADAASGAHANIRLVGIAVVEAGAAVTLMDIVVTDSVGRGVTGTSTDLQLGLALGAAGAAGDLFAVLLASPNAQIAVP